MTHTEMKNTCPGGPISPPGVPNRIITPANIAVDDFWAALKKCEIPTWEVCAYTLFSNELGYSYMHEKCDSEEFKRISRRSCMSAQLGSAFWNQEQFLSTLCDDLKVWEDILKDVNNVIGAERVNELIAEVKINFNMWLEY
jgi:hypothetical protein